MSARHWYIAMFGIVLACAHQEALAISSTRLKDVIAQGHGEIDLLHAAVQSNSLSMAKLEQFRLDNGGQLAFAVDVNENASGSESSHSQGVAIEYARVEITIGSQVHTFDRFSTHTQSVLAPAGENSRSLFYTLIGDSGSRLITGSTGSDINNSSFDATIRIPVDIDIGSASSAKLIVQLLETNDALGDPEAFYDFSGGFEDLAIVTATDATALDQTAAGRTDAPLVTLSDTSEEVSSDSRIYLPASDQYYVVAYEDQFPNKGDYDFNDVVVAYRVYYVLNPQSQVVGMGGEGFLVARGGGFVNDWHLRLALPSSASGSIQMQVFEPDSMAPLAEYSYTRSFWGAVDMEVFMQCNRLWTDGDRPFVNTLRDQTLIRGHRFAFSVQLDQVLPSGQVPSPPFDPYLYVHNTGYEVHLPNNAPVMSGSHNVRDGLNSFTDVSGYPFALILPQDWQVPIESIDLGMAYPELIEYVRGNQGVGDWYLRPSPLRTKPTHANTWKW